MALHLQNRLSPPASPASPGFTDDFGAAPAPCTCEADGGKSTVREMPTVATTAAPRRAPAMSQSGSPTHGTSAPKDVNRALRTSLLASARLLLGRGAPYPGELVVKIVADSDGLELRVKPTAEVSGLEADSAGAGSTADTYLLTRLEQMRAVLFSPDEEKLLRDLIEHEPCSATSVQQRCKAVVSKNDFWAAWGQLQKRRVVDVDGAGLYMVAGDWIREMLAGA